MVHLEKQNIILYVLNFKKGVAHMSIRLYTFSMHQIFKMNAHLPSHLKDTDLFELVKTYQIHAHSRTRWKYNKNEYRFSYG